MGSAHRLLVVAQLISNGLRACGGGPGLPTEQSWAQERSAERDRGRLMLRESLALGKAVSDRTTTFGDSERPITGDTSQVWSRGVRKHRVQFSYLPLLG